MTETEWQARIQAYEPVRPDDVVAAHERALEMGRRNGMAQATIGFTGRWYAYVTDEKPRGRYAFGYGESPAAAVADLGAKLAALPRTWTEAEVLATLGIEPAEARAA